MSASKRVFSNSNYCRLPFGEAALLLPFGRRSFLPAIVERFQGRPIDMGPNTDREAYHLQTGDTQLTLIYSGFGSPPTANALEKAAANGVQRVILFGPCGGVAKHVQVGDLIIPTSAVRGEGTSRYYMPVEIPAMPDAELHHRLLQVARDKGPASVHTGGVYTTDASYRQGPEVYEHNRDAAIGVDCECSAAFIVAAALGLRLASIFFCTDNVRLPDPAHRSRQGMENDLVRRAFAAAADIAIEALVSPSK